MQRRSFHQLAVLAAFPACSLVHAQSWPARPVKFIVAHPPGSGIDAIARIFADDFSRRWGQPVVLENRPGGQNTIGAQAVARSPADGYTIYLATAAALVTNVYLFKDLPYEPRKDFAPIGFVGHSPFALLVSATSPINSLQDFVARAKASPGKISVATEGPRSFGGITARLFNSRAKVATNVVSYTSSGAAMQDLMGGHTEAAFLDLPTAAQLVKQGKLRVLAVTTPKRVEGWDAPAISEVLPGFDMVGWFALVAPAGSPREAITRVNASLGAALQSKDITDKIHSIGPHTGAAGSPEDLMKFLAAEHQKWSEVSKEVGLLPE